MLEIEVENLLRLFDAVQEFKMVRDVKLHRNQLKENLPNSLIINLNQLVAVDKNRVI